jgi:L-ascorbate metabolism protein UlaG (beta-lactamase superfamily)
MSAPRRAVRRWTIVLAAALAAFALVGPAPFTAPAQAQGGTVKMEWFGWSFFRFTSPGGKVILINPWATNPDSTISVDDISQADVILVPNGHRDEIGEAVPLAQKTGARLWQPFELGTWFMEQGVPAAQVIRSNPGGRLTVDGVTLRMVGSVHGSGLPAPTATTPYGGPAAGFVITFENGWTVYFPGSSSATADQALWGSMYKPDAMIFHMGADKEPMDVAMSISLTMTDNPNLRTLLPHHHRVNLPAGATSTADVRAALDAMGIGIPILDQARSQVYEFTK